jgi:hypothetical protein
MRGEGREKEGREGKEGEWRDEPQKQILSTAQLSGAMATDRK